jgi:hypothetical protein
LPPQKLELLWGLSALKLGDELGLPPRVVKVAKYGSPEAPWKL